MQLPIGMIALIVVGVLVFFGIAQRVLDRMQLTDKQALLFIASIIAGSFFNITLLRTPAEVSINVGGAIIPLILVAYLFYKADTGGERLRAVIASLLAGATIIVGSRFLPNEPETMFLDPKLMYGLAAGLVAYIAGRSRRSAFIAGIMGVIIGDIGHMITLISRGIAGRTSIGGAGAFDAVVIAGLVAVMLAELVGETRERLQGGHKEVPGETEAGKPVRHTAAPGEAAPGQPVQPVQGRGDEDE